MSSPRRRLSPDERRAELVAVGAAQFGGRPYDEVRMDEIAELAGVSRALMYRYFPDKRSFFTAVVRSEGARMLAATSGYDLDPTLTLFQRVRRSLLAYLEYYDSHPHGGWALLAALDNADPAINELVREDSEQQVDRIMAVVEAVVAEPLSGAQRRQLRATLHGWLAFGREMCRQWLVEPSLDRDQLADLCAHSLFDLLDRQPELPPALAELMASRD